MSSSAFVPSPTGPSVAPSARAAALSRTSRSGASGVIAPVGHSAAVAPVLEVSPALARARAAPAPAPAGGAPAGAIVVLFRHDLRIDDHAPLVHANEEAAVVVPVVCFDPRHFGKSAYGFEKTGRYRACFLLDSVAALRKKFRQMGCDVVVRIGKPEEVVPDVCRKVGSKRVFLHWGTTLEEQKVEECLEDALKNDGAELKRFWGNTLYHIDDMPFGVEKTPDVYSEFREAVEKKAVVRRPLKAPESLAPLPPVLKTGDVPTLKDLSIDDPAPDANSLSTSSGVGSIRGGEDEAMRRLKEYVQDARRSDADMRPRSMVSAHLGADFSCRISPWLALGCISPRRIYEELRVASPNPQRINGSATHYELVWRDFFHCITLRYSRTRLEKALATKPNRNMAPAMCY